MCFGVFRGGAFRVLVCFWVVLPELTLRVPCGGLIFVGNVGIFDRVVLFSGNRFIFAAGVFSCVRAGFCPFPDAIPARNQR